MRLLGMGLLLIFSGACGAADTVRVVVEHSGKDRLGRQIAFELKEAIRGSQSFELHDGLDKSALWVNIVTLSADSQNQSSAVSLAFTVNDLTIPLSGFHVTSNVGVCGDARIQSCARSYLAAIDDAVRQVKEFSPAIYATIVVAQDAN